MIVNKRSFRLADGLLDGMKLLGQIKARPFLPKHLDDPPEMPFGAPKPLDDIGMCFVHVVICHRCKLSP